MNSPSGVARGSSLLSSRSVRTHGGGSSITFTDVPRSRYRNESVYEWTAALAAEYTAVGANGTNPSTDETLMAAACSWPRR